MFILIFKSEIISSNILFTIYSRLISSKLKKICFCFLAARVWHEDHLGYASEEAWTPQLTWQRSAGTERLCLSVCFILTRHSVNSGFPAIFSLFSLCQLEEWPAWTYENNICYLHIRSTIHWRWRWSPPGLSAAGSLTKRKFLKINLSPGCVVTGESALVLSPSLSESSNSLGLIRYVAQLNILESE